MMGCLSGNLATNLINYVKLKYQFYEHTSGYKHNEITVSGAVEVCLASHIQAYFWLFHHETTIKNETFLTIDKRMSTSICRNIR